MIYDPHTMFSSNGGEPVSSETEENPKRKKADPKKCAKCDRPIVYKLTPRERGQYSDPVAEHKKDTGPDDRFLTVSWLSLTSIRDRRKELAARCTYEGK